MYARNLGDDCVDGCRVLDVSGREVDLQKVREVGYVVELHYYRHDHRPDRNHHFGDQAEVRESGLVGGM